MKNNNISKIALLTGLLIINSKAKGFYQCVPKDDWFNKRFDTRMLYEKFKTAKTQIDNEKAWELFVENKTNGTLDVGIYKIIVAGGAGGDGGHGNTDHTLDRIYGLGGIGGKGEIKKEIFLLSKTIGYSACIGSKGFRGEGSWAAAGGGSGGSGSAFALSDNTFTINVSGGGGAGGGAETDRAGAGGGGGGYGCQIGGSGGNGNIFNNIGYGGSVGTIIKLSPNLMSSGISGEAGSDTRGTDSAVGGKGGQTCSNGGKGGWYSRNGADGSSCAEPENGNSGDGYVKIYKYIG